MLVLFLWRKVLVKLNWLFGWAKGNGIDIPIDYDGRADIAKLLETYEEWSKNQRENNSSASLTNQEWAKFYNRIGDIRRGDYVDKLPNGDIIVPIETKDRGVLIISSGKYGNEKVKSVYAFNTIDDMYDTLEVLTHNE